MTAATATMTEEKMMDLVRNALLAAGHEMGKVGDHWPVIKSTIYKVMQDWENLKTEREITAELQNKFSAAVKEMEKDLESCPAEIRPDAEKIVSRMRELYEARFSPVDLTMFVVCDEDMPIHIKRAQAMIGTLEEDNG